MIKAFNKVIISAFLSFCVIFTAQINACAVKNIDGRFPTNRQFQAYMEKQTRGGAFWRRLSKRVGNPLEVNKSKILLIKIEAEKDETVNRILLEVPIVTATNQFVVYSAFTMECKSTTTTFDLVKIFFYSNEFNAEDFEWNHSGFYNEKRFKTPQSKTKYPPIWGKRANVTYEDYQQEDFLEQVEYDRFTKEPPMDLMVWCRLTNMQFFEIVPNEAVSVAVKYPADSTDRVIVFQNPNLGGTQNDQNSQ